MKDGFYRGFYRGDPARVEAIEPYLAKCKVACVRTYCVVCITYWEQPALDYMAALELTPDEQWKRLVKMVAARGWSVVDYRDKTETIRGLACPTCTRLIAEPKASPTRISSSVLLPPFDQTKHRKRAV